MHETYTKVRENALSVLKSARNGRLFAEFCRILQLFAGFCSFLLKIFDFFVRPCGKGAEHNYM